MILWPRLPLPRARVIVASFADSTIAELQERQWQSAGVKLFAPTGGLPVDTAVLRSLRRKLEAIAEAEGFPGSATRAARRRTDDPTMKLLADLPIPAGEGLRPEMWAWVAVVLVPHVVQWRWSEPDKVARMERFAGSLVRNAFGRLWYQAAALGADGEGDERWQLSDRLGADQAVALLERPGLASNREVALAVGRAWAQLPSAARKEDVFRQAMKALIVRAAIQRFDVLSARTLDDIVGEVFSVTVQRMGHG